MWQQTEAIGWDGCGGAEGRGKAWGDPHYQQQQQQQRQMVERVTKEHAVDHEFGRFEQIEKRVFQIQGYLQHI